MKYCLAATMALWVAWLPCNAQTAIRRFMDTDSSCLNTGRYAVVEKGGKYGIIDTTGKEVLPFRYHHTGLVMGPGYTIAITVKSYNAWWKLHRWRFWPGFTLSGSSRDNRLFDTRVIVYRLKLSVLESGRVFVSQSHRDVTDPVYVARQLKFSGNHLLFQGKVYEVRNNKVAVQLYTGKRRTLRISWPKGRK